MKRKCSEKRESYAEEERKIQGPINNACPYRAKRKNDHI